MNTPDEREKMYIISRIVLHPTELVTSNFESLVTFAKDTNKEAYDARLEKLKEVQGYYKAWDNWLQLIHSLESLNSDGEYDDRFVPKATIERVNEKIEEECCNLEGALI
jgi:hypothetical protein